MRAKLGANYYRKCSPWEMNWEPIMAEITVHENAFGANYDREYCKWELNWEAVMTEVQSMRIELGANYDRWCCLWELNLEQVITKSSVHVIWVWNQLWQKWELNWEPIMIKCAGYKNEIESLLCQKTPFQITEPVAYYMKRYQWQLLRESTTIFPSLRTK